MADTTGDRHSVAFMVGVILGALGGALGTLVLTPLSGEQTREQLRLRTAGLRPGAGLPSHLDEGTYAAGADGGGVMASLRERVQDLAGDGGPVDSLRSKVQSLAGGASDAGGDEPVDGAVTLTPAANVSAHRGMERLEEAEARAEATAPPPGSGA